LTAAQATAGEERENTIAVGNASRISRSPNDVDQVAPPSFGGSGRRFFLREIRPGVRVF
jgi:hypothetical protein